VDEPELRSSLRLFVKPPNLGFVPPHFGKWLDVLSSLRSFSSGSDLAEAPDAPKATNISLHRLFQRSARQTSLTTHRPFSWTSTASSPPPREPASPPIPATCSLSVCFKFVDRARERADTSRLSASHARLPPAPNCLSSSLRLLPTLTTSPTSFASSPSTPALPSPWLWTSRSPNSRTWR